MKFQDKFYNVIDYNKCPSSEKEDEKCIFGKSYFHQIQPSYGLCFKLPMMVWFMLLMLDDVGIMIRMYKGHQTDI